MPDDEVLEETVEETAEVEPAAVEDEPSFSLSEDEWKSVRDFTTTAAPVLAQLNDVLNAPPPPAEEEELEYNPFDPESVQAMVTREAQRLLESELGPYKGLLGMMATERGEQLARDELETISQEVGAFDKDVAYLIGLGFLNENRDNPGEALRTAAQHAHTFEEKIRADERAKVIEEYKTLGQAPNETPGSGPGTEEIERIPTGSNRYETAIQRHLASLRPTHPVG